MNDDEIIANLDFLLNFDSSIDEEELEVIENIPEVSSEEESL